MLFFLFYVKIIKIICAIFTIAIEDLKLRMNNKNLLWRKSVIWFEPYIQKAKKMNTLYYFFYYRSQILIDLRAYA